MKPILLVRNISFLFLSCLPEIWALIALLKLCFYPKNFVLDSGELKADTGSSPNIGKYHIYLMSISNQIWVVSKTQHMYYITC